MNRKWTPGPWVVEDGSKSCHCCFDQTIYVKTVSGEFDYEIIAETLTDNEANAHIISAAPDLYEALERALEEWDSNTDWRNNARAALAKARGE